MKLAIKVIPSASQNELVGWLGDALKVRVQAKAEQGKANIAVEKTLAKALGLPRKNVQIVAGKTTSRKTVELIGIEAAQLQQKLEEIGFE